MILKYVGVNFSQSMKESCLGGELVVTEVDKDLLPKFKTAVEMNAHLDKLELWKYELYE